MKADEDDTARVILALLDAVESMAPGLTLNQLRLLLQVVRREGIRVSDLARVCGMSDAGVSRAVRAMATSGDAGALDPAYGLVELLRGQDARARHIAPTPAGAAFAARLGRLVTGDGDPDMRAADDRRTSASIP